MHLRVGQFVFFEACDGGPAFGIVTSEGPKMMARVFRHTLKEGSDLDLRQSPGVPLQVISERTFAAARDAGFDLDEGTLRRLLRAERRHSAATP